MQSAIIHQPSPHRGDGNIIEPDRRNKPKFVAMSELLQGNIYTESDKLTAQALDSEWTD